jgi:methionyl-tRNA synthetase
MVSGADAHGTPITVKAEQEGIPPQELADKTYKGFLKTFDRLNIQWDLFTTTESDNHENVSQNLFRVMYEHGDIYPKEIEQYYDPKAEQFLADRYIEGTCPHCGNTKARGDQCNDGCERTLDPTELIDPKSKLTGEKPVLKKHTILYFDLPKFTKELENLVEKSSDVWRERVQGFAKAWLKEGLRERAISRKLGYGIEVPIEEYKNQDIYVWFEAVMGYLSAAIEWADKKGDDSRWEHFWKNPNAKHYYFIAKDNIPFHTILWPAMLMAYNKKYENGKYDPNLPGETKSEKVNLPYDVPANQFLTEKGMKISKSKGTLLSADDLLDKYDTDLIRYFFCKYAPENHDKEFSWQDIVDANNNELVATFGNFINRVLSFTYTKLDGTIPEKVNFHKSVKDRIDDSIRNIGKHIESCEFTKATDSLIYLAHFGNKYFDEQQPWKTINENPIKAKETIFSCFQIIKALAIASRPFMPETSDKILKMIGEPTENVTWNFEPVKTISMDKKPKVLFQKLDIEEEQPEKKDYSNFKLEEDKELEEEIPVEWRVIKDIKIKRKDSGLKKWIEGKEKELIDKYKDKKLAEIPVFKSYREQHKKYSGENLPGASETITQFLLKNKHIPNINTFVDLYNIFSIETGIAVGAHDMTKLEGNVKLTLSDKELTYPGMGDLKPVKVHKGEFIYKDNQGVICRLLVKQGDRTKITKDTTDVLVIFQGNKEIDKKQLKQKMDDFELLVKNMLS